MTHSYALRAWAIEQMSQFIFGRETIAKAAGINPRTLSSWYRQETYRLKGGCHYPNEYERAFAIVVYRNGPDSLKSLSEVLKVPPRSIEEWHRIDRKMQYTSELQLRTNDGVVALGKIVEKDLQEYEINAYLADRQLWPDPRHVYEMTWLELDYRLRQMIAMEHIRRCGLPRYRLGSLPVGEQFSELREAKKIIVVGPHATRGSTRTSEEHVDRDEFTERNRAKGRFVGLDLGRYENYSGVAENLLMGFIRVE